jgi:16S rRNA processing protein RimM
LQNTELVLVGKVSGIFGTRGWLKLFSYTRPRSNLLAYPKLLLGPKHIEHKISDSKEHGNRLIALFVGISDRDQAANLVELEIFIERQALRQVNQGEYYWADLIGLEVLNREGVNLGRIAKMHETGANDVMELDSKPARLIPFVMHTYVEQVDLEAGKVLVDWHADD